MKAERIGFAVAALLLGACAAVAQAPQTMPAPSPLEKQLAARASDVTEVTLDKNMLGFASKFMNGKEGNDAETRKLIEGLQGIYVRDYEFDKEGEYTPADVEALRHHYEVGEWTPIVKERDRKSHETTDVLMKVVNGETRGLFVLDAEPKELTLVLILGPIRMEDLSKLSGLSGLSGLGALGAADGTHSAPQPKKGGTQ
ncbi:MAG: DUF4252 domain-containing protein [Acidobacteriota bacterium]